MTEEKIKTIKTIGDDEFETLLDKLLDALMPPSILIKILDSQPLSKEEAEQFHKAIIIASTARLHKNQRTILSKLDNISRGISRCRSNERTILHFVSDDPEKYTIKDDRKITSIKRVAVDDVCRIISSAQPGEERRIALKIYNKYKSVDGFYENFESFMKQISRTMADFWT